ncbi:oil body-associated protein 1A-like [Bidens hawaiensis]|uniref:oil body-associated protein 1A-like n=1 Tax=Bidens hawaiensis TaxID=980011 RepID=UPI00404B1F74
MDPIHANVVKDVPGEKTKIGTSIVDTAAATIQSFGPTKQIHQHLCAFHFYADDMTRQVEAHHYCGHLNDEVRQCLIYDRPDADARLIGVEYLVTEELFLTLPDEEKPLWHSHEYEVKSGVLFLPGVPGPVERKDLEKVAKTYGKTIHFWQVDRGDELPLGLPQVMMALTRDGQLYPNLAKDVESKYGVSFQKERENRAYMEGLAHGIHPKANAAGVGLKTVLREIDCKPSSDPPPSVPRVFV